MRIINIDNPNNFDFPLEKEILENLDDKIKN